MKIKSFAFTHKILFALLLASSLNSKLIAQSSGSKFTPPGTIKVGDLFFDEFEVSNFAWAEYLFHLKRDSTFPQYIAALPDTTVWYNIFEPEIADDYVLNYLYDEATANHPVVGVSYWQAVDYCFWRGTVVNKQLKSIKSDFRVNYRLPTPEEWEEIALSTAAFNLDQIKVPRERIEASFDRNRVRNIRNIVIENNPDVDGRINLNQLQEDLIGFFVNNPIYLFENLYFEEVPYFWPVLRNGLGPLEITYGDMTIKNLRGNVSEMTSVRNVAKGGNWSTTPSESEAEFDLLYSGPSALVGFRCICEVTSESEKTKTEKKVDDPDSIEWDN